MEQKIPMLIYAGDTEQDGIKIGIETKRRIERALKTRGISYIILGAGIRPDKPLYPKLKTVMREYIQTTTLIPAYEAEEDAWGTFLETLAMLKEIPAHTEEIFICSSWYHIPRIWVIWKILNDRQIKINWVFAKSPRLKSLLAETLSFGKLFFLTLPKWRTS